MDSLPPIVLENVTFLQNFKEKTSHLNQVCQNSCSPCGPLIQEMILIVRYTGQKLQVHSRSFLTTSGSSPFGGPFPRRWSVYHPLKKPTPFHGVFPAEFGGHTFFFRCPMLGPKSPIRKSEDPKNPMPTSSTMMLRRTGDTLSSTWQSHSRPKLKDLKFRVEDHSVSRLDPFTSTKWLGKELPKCILSGIAIGIWSENQSNTPKLAIISHAAYSYVYHMWILRYVYIYIYVHCFPWGITFGCCHLLYFSSSKRNKTTTLPIKCR